MNSHSVRQAGVNLECLFVLPARVNVEQLRIADRTKSVNAQTAGFLARMAYNVGQRLRDGVLIAVSGVKTREYK